MAAQSRHKEFPFPVEIEWDAGRRTTARVDGKPPLQIATPPEFRGTDPELWSPEDAFVAAAGSCLAVTVDSDAPLAPARGGDSLKRLRIYNSKVVLLCAVP